MNKYFLHNILKTRKSELSSGGQTACSTGFPHYVSVLGTRLYQYASWHFCERLCSASEFFFKNSFSIFVHFVMGDLQAHLPTQHWLVSSLTKKRHDPHTSPSLFTWSHLKWLFFFVPQMKKVLKGKHFANAEEVKQKKGRSTKRHPNWWVQKLFWAVEKPSR